MKVKSSPRYLQPFLQENWNKGMTTLELLLIILVITIVGAIVLPVIFRNREAANTRTILQQEVESNIDAMRDTQQNHYLNKNTFTNSLKDLKISSANQTENYEYLVQKTEKSAFLYGLSRKADLKSYVGAVFPGASKRTLTVTILCKANSPGIEQIANPTYENGVIACGAGTQELHHGEVTVSK